LGFTAVWALPRLDRQFNRLRLVDGCGYIPWWGGVLEEARVLAAAERSRADNN
jgi:hypothetical protein